MVLPSIPCTASTVLQLVPSYAQSVLAKMGLAH